MAGGIQRVSSLRLGAIALTVGAVAGCLAFTAGARADLVEVGYATHASDLAFDSNGDLWFAGVTLFHRYPEGGVGPAYEIGHRAADGKLSQYFPPSALGGGGGRHAIVATPDDAIWFAEPLLGRIGRIDAGGEATEFALPGGARPVSLAVGPEGSAWFTEPGTDRIGRIESGGQVEEFDLAAGSAPADLVAGPDGAIWVTEPGTREIARVAVDGAVTQYPLPGFHGAPAQIVAGADDDLWFTEPSQPWLGRITVAGQVGEFSLGSLVPAQISAGPNGDVWFTAEGRRIGSVSPSGAIARPVCVTKECAYPVTALASGPGHSLWFGLGPIDEAKVEGGGQTHIEARYAPGLAGEFTPPALRPTIARRGRYLGGRSVRVTLGCLGGAAGESCRGVLQVFGLRRFDLGTGSTRMVTLKVGPRARRRLESGRAVIVPANATAAGQTTFQTLVIR